MSLHIDQIAETFCSHRFVETYPYMTDEIKWKVVGGKNFQYGICSNDFSRFTGIEQ